MIATDSRLPQAKNVQGVAFLQNKVGTKGFFELRFSHENCSKIALNSLGEHEEYSWIL